MIAFGDTEAHHPLHPLRSALVLGDQRADVSALVPHQVRLAEYLKTELVPRFAQPREASASPIT
ncbi:hypothetical protein GCM10017774_38430 [Lentzea cavernae]|uniref:Uncharacterized protein n=1 Tax=Lentzea cavernae TaxID=2020703 RepID=A0ABQ3MH90_9PSEU|nr:hypothetical protein GCM10017774_38430 [Lentzea cavernae]